MGKKMVPEQPLRKGRLPACTINSDVLQELWAELHKDGDFVWVALVGTGGDLLGKEDERPYQEPTSWEELGELLQSIPRIDRFHLTAEIPGQGTIGIQFKNYTSPTAALLVTGPNRDWVEHKYRAVKAVFDKTRDDFATPMYSWLGFGVVQSAIPLTVASLLVLGVTLIVIPSGIRHSYYIWWITTITMIITLRLAYTISNRLIIRTLTKYPYIQWRS